MSRVDVRRHCRHFRAGAKLQVGEARGRGWVRLCGLSTNLRVWSLPAFRAQEVAEIAQSKRVENQEGIRLLASWFLVSRLLKESLKNH